MRKGHLTRKECEDFLYNTYACVEGREWFTNTPRAQSIRDTVRSCHEGAWVLWAMTAKRAGDGYAPMRECVSPPLFDAVNEWVYLVCEHLLPGELHAELARYLRPGGDLWGRAVQLPVTAASNAIAYRLLARFQDHNKAAPIEHHWLSSVLGRLYFAGPKASAQWDKILAEHLDEIVGRIETNVRNYP